MGMSQWRRPSSYLQPFRTNVIRRSLCLASSRSCETPAIYRHHHFCAQLPPDSVVFSGIQPTGVPHLGNYLGALRQWVWLQNQADISTKLIFSIVDLHALTMARSLEQLQHWKRQTLAALLAVGLNPERSIIFFQSDVPAHSELMWILSCTASMGYLSRMTQWKSKLSVPDDASPSDAIARTKLKLGLFSYPVLQAADILVHRATHVPVGEDQKQHLEFARECVQTFNALHGRIFNEPEIIISLARRVMSLKEPTKKMSKSHEDPRSRILLTDKPQDIRSKIKSALTDSIDGIDYDPQTRPGVSNLLNISSYLDDQGRRPESIAREFRGTTLKAFKEKIADDICCSLEPIRALYNTYMATPEHGYLAEVARRGAMEAQENSNVSMNLVRRSLGIVSTCNQIQKI